LTTEIFGVTLGLSGYGWRAVSDRSLLCSDRLSSLCTVTHQAVKTTSCDFKEYLDMKLFRKTA
jgi:hypothetical protein